MKDENKMTEPEFQDMLMRWAMAGMFDDIGDSKVRLGCGFGWIEYAEGNYTRIYGRNYDWCGITFSLKPNSKIFSVTQIID